MTRPTPPPQVLWNGYINIAKVPQLIGAAAGNAVEGAANAVQHNWMEEGGDDFDPFATVAPGEAKQEPVAKKAKKG